MHPLIMLVCVEPIACDICRIFSIKARFAAFFMNLSIQAPYFIHLIISLKKSFFAFLIHILKPKITGGESLTNHFYLNMLTPFVRMVGCIVLRTLKNCTFGTWQNVPRIRFSRELPMKKSFCEQILV